MKLKQGWIAYWEEGDWLAEQQEVDLDEKIKEMIDTDRDIIIPIKKHITIDIPDVVATGKVEVSDERA